MNKKKLGTKICLIIAILLLVIIIGVLVFGYYKKQTLNISNPIVTMEVENFGTIKIELYPSLAPETVNNFITLANNGYYNGLKFHRVVKDFMIQGGDKAGDGTGTPTFADLYNNEDENASYKYSNGNEAKGSDSYSIKGEFVANKDFENNLNLTEGTLAMARSDYSSYSPSLSEEGYNSAGSQFFIMTTNDHTNLSGYYAGFGKVIEGMDVVKKISEVECKAASADEENSEEENSEESSDTENSEETEETSESEEEVSTPVEDVKISSVTVDTFGVSYEKPETLEPFNYTEWLYSQYGMQYTE